MSIVFFFLDEKRKASVAPWLDQCGGGGEGSSGGVEETTASQPSDHAARYHTSLLRIRLVGKALQRSQLRSLVASYFSSPKEWTRFVDVVALALPLPSRGRFPSVDDAIT